jgi:putative membrane protein
LKEFHAPSDPRVFFAAERTLLAWLRSGLTIMGLGFVVARFGLFLNVMTLTASQGGRPAAPPAHWPSSSMGIALVAFGALAIVGALVNFRAYVRLIPPADVPPLRLPWLTAVLCAALAILGFLLAGYLAAT